MPSWREDRFRPPASSASDGSCGSAQERWRRVAPRRDHPLRWPAPGDPYPRGRLRIRQLLHPRGGRGPLDRPPRRGRASPKRQADTALRPVVPALDQLQEEGPQAINLGAFFLVLPQEEVNLQANRCQPSTSSPSGIRCPGHRGSHKRRTPPCGHTSPGRGNRCRGGRSENIGP